MVNKSLSPFPMRVQYRSHYTCMQHLHQEQRYVTLARSRILAGDAEGGEEGE